MRYSCGCPRLLVGPGEDIKRTGVYKDLSLLTHPLLQACPVGMEGRLLCIQPWDTCQTVLLTRLSVVDAVVVGLPG